jgi:hypothetical protein
MDVGISKEEAGEEKAGRNAKRGGGQEVISSSVPQCGIYVTKKEGWLRVPNKKKKMTYIFKHQENR